MIPSKILVVEDNTAEAIYAQAELAKAGIKEFRAVTTLKEALDELPSYNGILTDLFFPAGEITTKPYIDRFLPYYEQYKEKRFPKEKNDIVLRAVKSCADVFGMTPQEYFDQVMCKLPWVETHGV